MLDRFGLLMDNMPNLVSFQNPLVQKQAALQDWEVADKNMISLIKWLIMPNPPC
jgi:malate dehydrogenase (oxaloacetate-decarboxylating)